MAYQVNSLSLNSVKQGHSFSWFHTCLVVRCLVIICVVTFILPLSFLLLCIPMSIFKSILGVTSLSCQRQVEIIKSVIQWPDIVEVVTFLHCLSATIWVVKRTMALEDLCDMLGHDLPINPRKWMHLTHCTRILCHNAKFLHYKHRVLQGNP